MHPIAVCAENALRRHAHPALRISELLDLIAEEMDRTLDEGRLRAILEAHPNRFQILDPWTGPWRAVPTQGEIGQWPREAWVVAVVDPGEPPAGPAAPVIRLKETVRWLARGIDPRSAVEVSRWHAIALAERAVREAVARRAA